MWLLEEFERISDHCLGQDGSKFLRSPSVNSGPSPQWLSWSTSAIISLGKVLEKPTHCPAAIRRRHAMSTGRAIMEARVEKEYQRQIPVSERLIFALDVGSANEARGLVRKLRGGIRFFKVGLELYTAAGPDIVRWLLDRKLKVFLDLKMDDVPTTITRAVRAAARLGVTFLTVQGSVATTRAASQGARGTELQVLFVTLLTSLNEEDLRDQSIIHPAGRFTDLESYLIWRAGQALGNGCHGLITSGQNAPLFRRQYGDKPLLVCPGIRLAGESVDDHKRAMTPAEAILAKADYLVVGRPIREARNPVAQADEIIGQIDSALDRMSIWDRG